MAQFIIPPPLTKIAPIFVSVTGQPLEHGATWNTWNQLVDLELLHAVRQYYRPCHQKLINELIAYPTQSPLALLRQLLRPYDIYIERTQKDGWKLTRKMSVIRSEGKDIKWN